MGVRGGMGAGTHLFERKASVLSAVFLTFSTHTPRSKSRTGNVSKMSPTACSRARLPHRAHRHAMLVVLTALAACLEELKLRVACGCPTAPSE